MGLSCRAVYASQAYAVNAVNLNSSMG